MMHGMGCTEARCGVIQAYLQPSQKLRRSTMRIFDEFLHRMEGRCCHCKDNGNFNLVIQFDSVGSSSGHEIAVPPPRFIVQPITSWKSKDYERGSVYSISAQVLSRSIGAIFD